MVRFILFLSFTLIFLSSCQEKTTDFSKKLVGKWEYDLMEVVVNFEKEESSSFRLHDEASWKKNFKMKPMQIVYANDGFFKINYRDAKGNFRYAITGDWTLEGTQLRMKQDPPYEGLFKYDISDTENDGLQLQGMIDWDRENEDDDKMTIHLKSL